MDIKIKIVPNPFYTPETASVQSPFKFQVVHTGTVTAADICAACKADNPQMTEPLASLATETILDYGSDRTVEDVVRFSLGSEFFTMEPGVDGSVPTMDAPLSEENTPCIRIVNGQTLNARIAALKPVIVTDELGDVQFHSVEATHGGETYKNAVFAGDEFTVLGKRLGGEGQTLEMRTDAGIVLSAATFIEGDQLGQRFKYKLATPPALPGRHLLTLTSTGKDTPDARPKSKEIYVDYLPPEPTVTDVSSEGHTNEVVSGTAFAANGSGLDAFGAGDTAKVKWTQDGEPKEATITPASVTATKMSFAFPAALQSAPMGTELTFEITFGETVKSKGSTLVGI